jgi:hypothetical protein
MRIAPSAICAVVVVIKEGQRGKPCRGVISAEKQSADSQQLSTGHNKCEEHIKWNGTLAYVHVALLFDLQTTL